MNKKFISIAVSTLIVFNNISCISSIYGEEKNVRSMTMENESKSEKQVVYLSEGEGSETLGDGTQQNPYRNIRTALKNIQDGGILKIVGSVSYTKYEVHYDGSALPLFIDKSITIENGSNKSPLAYDADEFVLRAPIQLGANVTFKDINLELVPQITFGKNSNQSNGELLGEELPRSATIYVAGNKLTLDNINTKVGTSISQDASRPYISGGSYKNEGKIGSKAIINIINPNSETKFSTIYAGDYWRERSLDVEINLDGNVLEKKIYAGGLEHDLNGTVDINLGIKGNIKSIDNSNHKGNINLNLEKDVYRDDMEVNDINNLSLGENARIILKEGSKFNVNNVILGENSVLDFRKINSNPIVNGDFQGIDTINTLEIGCILLSNKQTLDVQGEVLGTTKLNHRDTIYTEMLEDNHEYVRGKLNSRGEFKIDPYVHDNFKLNKNSNNNYTTWTAIRNKEIFKDFEWDEKNNTIINSSSLEDHIFPIRFINDNNKLYIPYGEDWDEFEFTLEKVDGTVLDEDTTLDDPDIFFMINYFTSEVFVNIYDADYQGNIILSVKHKPSNKSISKTVSIIKEDNKLTGKVNISGNLTEGNTISADTSNLPNDIKNIIYKWYVNNTLVSEQTNKDLKLTKEHIGKKVRVEVEVENYTGSISSEAVLVKPSQGPTIVGGKDITIKEGDTFNSLKGITATDATGKDLTSKINVNGSVTTTKVGTYILTYKVSDVYGNTTTVTRKVTVRSNEKPVISDVKDTTIKVGDKFNTKTGITAKDKEDGSLTSKIKISGSVDTTKVGIYKLTYKVSDSDGNTKTVTRKVTVKLKDVLGVKASSNSYNSIKLTWKKTENIDGYEIYRSTSKTWKNKSTVTVKNNNTLSYTHTSLKTGQTYYYKIRAYNMVNGKKVYSNYSSVVSSIPKLSTPNITLSAGSKKAYISWKKISGASGYEIRRSLNKTGSNAKLITITKGNTTSYTNSKLTSKKTYYYKVRAYRIVNGKKVYSSYSSTKYTKVK